MEEMIVKEEKHELSPFADSQSFQKIFDIGKMFATSQLVPQNYQGKPMDCTIAVDMANRMGVSPMMVMQNLYVVKGKPTWSGQACMSMIRASEEFKNVRLVYSGEPNTDGRGCRVEAEYKSDGTKAIGTTVTIGMAKEMKWYDKPGSLWKTMPEQMLSYRAAAYFARSYIPNALMGMHVEGEPEDICENERETAENPFDFEAAVQEAQEVFE